MMPINGIPTSPLVNPFFSPENVEEQLCKALENDNLCDAERLLRTLTRVTTKGSSALLIAAEKNYASIIPVLLQKGADPGIKTQEGCSPLYIACVNGHIEAASALINADNINERNGSWGYTALAAAAWKDHTGIVKLLLEKGADSRIETQDGGFPLYIACVNGHIETASALINADNINERNGSNKATALAAAAWSGRTGIVKLLLEKGADSGIKTQDEASPLYFACRYGHVDAASALIDAGVNINERNGSNKATALAAAAWKGHTGIVKLLLANGADTGIKTQDERSPLYFACKYGHVDAASALINAGVNINEKNGPHEATALAVAANKNRKGVVKLLLANDADPKIKTKDGRSPLDFARKHDYVKTATALSRSIKLRTISTQ